MGGLISVYASPSQILLNKYIIDFVDCAMEENDLHSITTSFYRCLEELTALLATDKISTDIFQEHMEDLISFYEFSVEQYLICRE